jgi:hypothetical protein
MSGVTVRLPAEWLIRSEEFGADCVRVLSAASLARSVLGSADTLGQFAEGRRAECAAALGLGLDPDVVIDWDRRPDVADGGFDLDAGGLLIDVKSTLGGRLLLYTAPADFASKRFDVLLLLRGRFAEWRALGWISKRAFFARKQVSDGARVSAGTWWVDSADLWSVAELLVVLRHVDELGAYRRPGLSRLAVDCGADRVSDFVRGLWPR